jgi:hypothetical protein
MDTKKEQPKLPQEHTAKVRIYSQIKKVRDYFLSNDGKLYIDACDGETFGIEPMHDMFRIYNYDAEPCHSVEEVLQRCKENNVELTKEQLKELNDWFGKYPDTIITFG